MKTIKLPKFKYVESKYFPLQENYSESPFSEYDEYCNALDNREAEVTEYCRQKLGNFFNELDYPTRMNIPSANGKREYYHINEAYYSLDYSQRVLISLNETYNEITVIYQIAQSSKAE